MSKNYELIIYGVQYGEADGDKFVDNYTIENFDDNKFIYNAEQEGNVFTVTGLLRKLEECTYGATNFNEEFYNTTFRAYLVNKDNPDEIIRVDHENLLFEISNINKVSEVL